ESNPAPPRERGATDFEDREGRRAPFTSVDASVTAVASLSKDRLQDRLGIAEILEHDIGSSCAQLIDGVIPGGDRDRSRAARLRARDIERRIADDHGVRSRERRTSAAGDARERLRHQTIAIGGTIAKCAAPEIPPKIEVFQL